MKRFVNIWKFCNHDLNKFVLLLQKGVYPYECMDGWEKFDETSVPVKEDLYNSLNMERHIADADYNHAKRVRKERGIKNVCE